MASNNLGFDINPHGTELVVVQTTFLILSWIVCVLRGYVRVFLIRKIALEDWFMLVALVSPAPETLQFREQVWP